MQGYSIESIKMVKEVPGSTDLKPGTLGSTGLKILCFTLFEVLGSTKVIT